MGLLHDIQAALLDEKVGVGSALLKLRFLAAKLGSVELEAWVKHETEGYPKDADVPGYRTTGHNFTGLFTNAVWQTTIEIPPYIIKQHAGEGWSAYSIRESVAATEYRIANRSEGEEYGVNASNLVLLLGDKVVAGCNCMSVKAVFDPGVFADIQAAVRARALDLTLQIERDLPAASEIEVGKAAAPIGVPEREMLERLVVTIVGNQTINNVNNSGAGASISLNNLSGDAESFILALKGQGVPDADAKAIEAIIAEEGPQSPQEPLGKRAQAWFAEKGAQGAKAAWGIGIATATEMAKQYAKDKFFPG